MPPLDTYSIKGASDPYCLVTVLGARTGSKIRTKTIWKNLNPVWNEKYEFEIVSPDKAEVQVEVWDEDYLTSDDFMGQLIIPLSEVPLNQVVDKWYTLQKKKDKDKIKGDIHISMQYYDSKVRLSSMRSRPRYTSRNSPHQLLLVFSSSFHNRCPRLLCPTLHALLQRCFRNTCVKSKQFFFFFF